MVTEIGKDQLKKTRLKFEDEKRMLKQMIKEYWNWTEILIGTQKAHFHI